MTRDNFDTEAFHAALDGQRRARNLTWKQVAEQAGVSASTLTRMAKGKRPDVDGFAALSGWSGLTPTRFFRINGVRSARPAALAVISSSLRTDPNLSRDAARMLDEMVKSTYERVRRK